MKSEIMSGLDDIRKKLNDLMSTNQGREELAKLKEHEFYLDLDELERLHKEADTEILEVRIKKKIQII